LREKTRPVLLAALLALNVVWAGCADVEDIPPVGQDEVDTGGGKADDGREATVRIRMMAGNITSGNLQAYEEPGIRLFKGVAPDIAAIQEFNYRSNSAADLRAFVDAAFGPGFYYYREGGAQIPNGIVSRWPIVASGEWDDVQVTNRDFAWARIDIPGPTDLTVVSVHLLTASPEVRNLEAQALLGLLQALAPGSYYAVGGDFNTKARDEACLLTFSQALVTAGPYPADHAGVNGTNAGRVHPTTGCW
jgi:endonuclease/exonuclease/phosphatase family metal-dependent hydrolase